MFTIRPACNDDIDKLVELRMDFLQEMQGNPESAVAMSVRQATQAFYRDKMGGDEFLMWLAHDEETVIGTGSLVFFRRPPTFSNPLGLDAYVMNMYTLPEWRHQGIATALLRQIIKSAQERRVRWLWLHAADGVKSLYEQAGFVSVDNIMELKATS